MNELRRPKVRAFISYSHLDRKFGAQAKELLKGVGIEAFLAHDDIEVSEEWRTRIIDELKRCEIFVPLFSEHFIVSGWAQQEVGFIVSRPEVATVPLSIDGTIPTGFLTHVQSGRISSAGITRELLVEPLARRLPRQVLPGLIQITGESESFRDAEANMRPLVPLFPQFAPDEAQALAEAAIGNRQIWSATLCREEYIPELIRTQSANIAADTLLALEYQINTDRDYANDQSWYRVQCKKCGTQIPAHRDWLHPPSICASCNAANDANNH